MISATDKEMLLSQVSTLTEAMLKKASDEQWSALPELQKKRSELLVHIFPIKDNEVSTKCRSLLEKIIEYNQQLEHTCRDAQLNLQLELQNLNKNRKAVAAYQSS